MQLESLQCASCHVVFALTTEYMDARYEDHKGFYCPNGHSNVYKANNELEKTKTLLRNARSRTVRAEERAAQCCQVEKAAVRRATAYKGHVTRLKKRTNPTPS